MALMQITVIPMGTDGVSVGEYVADVQLALENEDVSYQLTDMGTIVEGDKEGLLALAAKISELPFAKGVQRVVTQIVLDDRRDRKVTLGEKTASVHARLKSYRELS